MSRGSQLAASIYCILKLQKKKIIHYHLCLGSFVASSIDAHQKNGYILFVSATVAENLQTHQHRCSKKFNSEFDALCALFSIPD